MNKSFSIQIYVYNYSKISKILFLFYENLRFVYKKISNIQIKCVTKKRTESKLTITTRKKRCRLTTVEHQRTKVIVKKYTSFTAFCAASRLVNVTNAYPRLVPVIGSIIKRRSHIVPHFSNSGINSSSNMSFGIFPQKTSQPLPGVGPSQFGGGPPYFL